MKFFRPQTTLHGLLSLGLSVTFSLALPAQETQPQLLAPPAPAPADSNDNTDSLPSTVPPPPAPGVEDKPAEMFPRIPESPPKLLPQTGNPQVNEPAMQEKIRNLHSELEAIRKLRIELSSSAQQMDGNKMLSTLNQQQEFRSLLVRLLIERGLGVSTEPEIEKSDDTTAAGAQDVGMIDPYAAGRNFFLMKDYEKAEKRFRESLDQKDLDDVSKNRIRFLIASCLRMTDKLEDAEKVYLEVIKSAGQASQLGQLAQRQLDNIGARRRLDRSASMLRQFIGASDATTPEAETPEAPSTGTPSADESSTDES